MTAELACAVLSYQDEPFLVDAVRSVLDQGIPVEVVVVKTIPHFTRHHVGDMGVGPQPVRHGPDRDDPGLGGCKRSHLSACTGIRVQGVRFFLLGVSRFIAGRWVPCPARERVGAE